MSLSLEACRSYTHGDVAEALAGYDVVKYKSPLISRVNDICLEMGCFCKGDKPKFERLAKELTNEINSITTDESEKDKLNKYAIRIIEVGRSYLMLTKDY
jgi:hypothetical protein